MFFPKIKKYKYNTREKGETQINCKGIIKVLWLNLGAFWSQNKPATAGVPLATL